MDRVEVVAAIERCDRHVAQAHAILRQLDAAAPLDEDQVLYRKILQDRIDTNLDLRNFYAAGAG